MNAVGVIRTLAAKVNEIARSDEMQRRRQMFGKLNRLEWDGPPPIVASLEQAAFNEVLPTTYAGLPEDTCSIIHYLYQQLWYSTLGDDHIIEPWIPNIPHYCDQEHTMWGVESSALFTGNETIYFGGIETPRDCEYLRQPKLVLDATRTLLAMDRMNQLLGGILEVRTDWRHPMFTVANFGTWVMRLLGQERFYMWCSEQPDVIKNMMAMITDTYMHHHVDLQSYRRLTDNNCFIPDFYPWCGESKEHPTLKDMWVHADSQEFQGVSPEMTWDYFLVYLTLVFPAFAHASFGCCESLNGKLGLVKQLPNIRRLTVSEVTDWNQAIEAFGNTVLYSVRPRLTDAMFLDDLGKSEYELREMAARFKGLQWEVSMPGVSTFRGQKDRLHKWVAMARKVVGWC